MRAALLILISAFLVGASPVNAQSQFIKYKKYLIPISVDKTVNLYYIDDVDDSRQSGINADPNGVQELPIVVGWKNAGHYNLVGVGASGPNGVSYNTSFTQNLLSLMGESTPVYTGTALRDSIIEKALSLGSPGSRVVIAIGGPREIILDALQHADSIGTPINNLIGVVGIQACRNGTSVTNCPNPSVGPAIQSAIGQENYHIVVDDGSPAPGRQPPSFRWFYSPTLGHVGNRNSWYQTHYHQSVIGRYFRDNVSNGYKLDEQNMVLNGCTEYNISAACGNKNPLSRVPSGLRRTLRAADFTALAYVIWGDDIWSSEFETRMYSELETGLATLPK